VQNRNDQLCFYSILAHIHHVESDRNPSRVCHYRHFLPERVTTGLTFTLAVKDVAKFERLNEDVAVNVMTFDERQPIPLYVKPHRQRKHVFNLLLLIDDESSAHHYVLIRDLARLVRGRYKHHGKAFVCQYCLHCFRCEHTLTEHIPQCSIHTPQVVTYPKPDDAVLHYTAMQKEHPVPYVLYVNLETFQTPDDGGVAVHEASGFCCVCVSRVDIETFEPFLYSGPDVLTEFYRHIYAEQEAICKKLSIEKEMAPFTDVEERLYRDASVCQNCHNNFDSKSRIETRHHCHTTGRFLGPVCASCNLQLKYRKRSRTSENDDNEFFYPRHSA